jgi:FKBP-type peptidyl-prolyl cis-trans isomerase FklB
MFACIDPDQTQEASFERERVAIEKFLQENPIASVKEYAQPNVAFYMFWQVSTNPERNTLSRVDTVRINYTGKTLTGKIFDTSIEQVAKDNNIFDPARSYQPISLVISRFIPGFQAAVSMMHPGEKAKVIFPSQLGYGAEAVGDIPANSPLMFELELIQVAKGPNLNP